eukprot:TRINITY_DN9400_c0_g1_i1.p1 TRINITY_DN9400_c0_g1~~TRINITY_DN9400_c0_g1_i1.p1  ORF type:complete len:491 (+),score=136.29 TRINITY_DN9400_c0_g1_i1:62-1534(+)
MSAARAAGAGLARFQLRPEGKALEPRHVGMLLSPPRRIALDPAAADLDIKVRELRGRSGKFKCELTSYGQRKNERDLFEVKNKAKDSITPNIRQLHLYKSRGITTKDAVQVLQDALKRDRVRLKFDDDAGTNENACHTVVASPPISEADVRAANHRFQRWVRSGTKRPMKEYAKRRTKHFQGKHLKKAEYFVQLAEAPQDQAPVFGEQVVVRAVKVPIVTPTAPEGSDGARPPPAPQAGTPSAGGGVSKSDMKHILLSIAKEGFVNYFDSKQCADGAAYDCVLWNILASVRAASFGRAVVPGDLVLPGTGVDNCDYRFAELTPPQGFDRARYERLLTPAPAMDPSELVVVKDDAEARRHRICDVVLPVPLLRAPNSDEPAPQPCGAVFPQLPSTSRDAYARLARTLLQRDLVGCAGYRHIVTRPFLSKTALSRAFEPLDEPHMLMVNGKRRPTHQERDKTKTTVDLDFTLLHGTSRAALLHQLFLNSTEF